jgi:hypothetical protein
MPRGGKNIYSQYDYENMTKGCRGSQGWHVNSPDPHRV